MERGQSAGKRFLNLLFQTGYPTPVNLFVAVMLLLLPFLNSLAEAAAGTQHMLRRSGWPGIIAVAYLAAWTRVRIYDPERSSLFIQLYLILQTAVVSLIYILEGGLTRYLFIIVAVQAVYVAPVRRWAPFLATLGTLWLTLYIVLSPNVPGANQVAVIGMYLCYLIFAAVVTYTTVQQESQVQAARGLLDAVDRQHQSLRIYDLTVEHLAEVEERERLAQTIYATLHQRLGLLLHTLEQLKGGLVPLNRNTARAARLQAKEVLAEIRQAVRTLRPDSDVEADGDSEDSPPETPTRESRKRVPDPLRIFHVWNLGVIIITIGVMVASDLVGRGNRWEPILLYGLGLLAAYAASAVIQEHRLRTLMVVIQAALSLWLTRISAEPLMAHLLMIIAAQMVLLVPMLNRWVAAAVIFPTLMAGAVLWSDQMGIADWRLWLSLTLAFGVTYFFSAVMAFMTRREVEARQQAVLYTSQMALVNRMLEAKLEQVRRVVVARERIRMAREIHDSWGHHLTMAIVELQYTETLQSDDVEGAQQHIAAAISVVHDALQSGRGMVQALERFDQPFPGSLVEMVEAWRTSSGVAVSLAFSGDLSTLPHAMRSTLFRTVQECLTNIQKHASARTVEVSLSRQHDRVLLTVFNDNASSIRGDEAGGYGLLGLRERAEALQGELAAQARIDGGFEVKLILPLGA